MAERAGPVFPPCLENPAAQRALRELERVLTRELPGTIVAVTWAGCLWQRHRQGREGGEHLGKDPWGEGSTKRIYVSIGGAAIEEPQDADKALQDRYGPGHRRRDTTEKMVIGTYWSTRFYEGYPERERNPGKRIQPKDPPEGGFRSILEAVPEAKAHALGLATEMQRHYLQTKIGNNLLIIPPDERGDLVGVGWTFQEEVTPTKAA